MYVAQERFFRRVRTNLHVIVCLNYPSDQFSTLQKFPFSRFSEFPSLLTRTCCIDVFQPWHGSSLVQVSALRLADQHVVAAVQQIIDTCKSSVATIMSYVHTSSVKMQERQFGFNQYKCYTPKTFVEFVDIFAKCCDLIWKEEQVYENKKTRFSPGKLVHPKKEIHSKKLECFLAFFLRQTFPPTYPLLNSYFPFSWREKKSPCGKRVLMLHGCVGVDRLRKFYYKIVCC